MLLEDFEGEFNELYGDGVHVFKNCKTGEITLFANDHIVESFEKIPYTPESLAEDILLGFQWVGKKVTSSVYETIRNETEFNPEFKKIAEIFWFRDECDFDSLQEEQKLLFYEALELKNEFLKRNDLGK